MSCPPLGIESGGASPFHSRLYLQIQESEHIKVENSESGSKLTILAARQEHCGCYTLVVESKLGIRQAQVNLTVVGKSGKHSSGRWRRGSKRHEPSIQMLETLGGI